jgi:hypothetical protein
LDANTVDQTHNRLPKGKTLYGLRKPPFKLQTFASIQIISATINPSKTNINDSTLKSETNSSNFMLQREKLLILTNTLQIAIDIVTAFSSLFQATFYSFW